MLENSCESIHNRFGILHSTFRWLILNVHSYFHEEKSSLLHTLPPDKGCSGESVMSLPLKIVLT